AIAVERAFWRRAEPEVVIDSGQVRSVVGRLDGRRLDVQFVLLAGRHRAIRVLADAGPRFEAETARHVDLADTAVLHEFDRLANRGTAAVHGADLNELVVVRGRFHHLAAFPHGV